MRTLAMLYTCLALAANAASAGEVDRALLVGDMAKLVLSDPKALPEVGLVDMADAPHTLAEFKGTWVVVNFWATWCVPCRTEMPSLDRLQAAMPGIAVVTVATGPNALPAIGRFMTEAGIVNVTQWRDPASDLAHQVGVLGLPVTLVVSPEGAEVARLIGGAEWDSPEAGAVLTALMK